MECSTLFSSPPTYFAMRSSRIGLVATILMMHIVGWWSPSLSSLNKIYVRLIFFGYVECEYGQVPFTINIFSWLMETLFMVVVSIVLVIVLTWLWKEYIGQHYSFIFSDGQIWCSMDGIFCCWWHINIDFFSIHQLVSISVFLRAEIALELLIPLTLVMTIINRVMKVRRDSVGSYWMRQRLAKVVCSSINIV